MPRGQPAPCLGQPANTVAPPSHMLVLAINPALVSLPSELDANLLDPPTITKAQGHKATKKVAGSCQKGKGK